MRSGDGISAAMMSLNRCRYVLSGGISAGMQWHGGGIFSPSPFSSDRWADRGAHCICDGPVWNLNLDIRGRLPFNGVADHEQCVIDSNDSVSHSNAGIQRRSQNISVNSNVRQPTAASRSGNIVSQPAAAVWRKVAVLTDAMAAQIAGCVAHRRIRQKPSWQICAVLEYVASPVVSAPWSSRPILAARRR